MASSTMKIKAIKFHPFELINQWGVTALHKVPIYINPTFGIRLVDGISLDVEDDEEGNFVGLGVYIPNPPMTLNGVCYYWSDFNFIKGITLPKFIAHNGISDIRKLQKWGFNIDESWLLYDTQLMGHIIDSSLRTYGLKDMVKRELGFEYPSYESICGKKISKGHKTLKDFPVEHVAAYNSCDTYYCYMLFQKQLGQCHG
jgi:DNA polymerase I-like protein with 3'-5' exonuclease and polymerase domains